MTKRREENQRMCALFWFFSNRKRWCVGWRWNIVYIYIYTFFEISSSRVGLGEQVVRPCVCAWCVVVEKKERERRRIEWMRHPPRPERDGFQQSFSNGRPFFFSFFLSFFLFFSYSSSIPPPSFLLIECCFSPPLLFFWLPAMLGNIPLSFLLLSLLLLLFPSSSPSSPLPASGSRGDETPRKFLASCVANRFIFLFPILVLFFLLLLLFQESA